MATETTIDAAIDTTTGTGVAVIKRQDVPDVSKLCDAFEDAFDATQQEREDGELARDYYDGYQLSETELAALAKRKQPPVISNRIGPKIDSLIGMEIKMRREPKAYPRTPNEEQAANAASDAIKYVADNSDFDDVRTDAAENMFIQGIAAATVTVTMRRDEPEIRITHVPWDRFYRDPHSRRRDFADASYLGTVIWMDEDEAVAMFPGKSDVIESCYAEGAVMGDTYDDRPSLSWGDRKRHRVRVLQHRFRWKGEWWTCVFCRGGYLRDPQPSPYVNEHGEPQCDLIATSCYVDRQNRRYGIVKRHISPQDEINKRRSKALHLLNSQQVIVEKGAVDDVKQARQEAARPDGWLEVNNNMRFEFVNRPDLVQGQFALLQESKNEIDKVGINPSIEGDAQAPSGRAQELLMQSGMNEVGLAFDSLRHWSWNVYRQVWYRVRQYWTAEKWIRVTDDEKNLKWVGVNRKITAGEVAEKQGQPMQPGDPMAQQVAGVENELASLDVDIILEDAPESINLQSEQFEKLVDLKRADPQAIPTKAIIEASQLRNKDQILEYMEQHGIPPQVQQQMQAAQQAVQQLQQQLQQAQQQAQSKQAEHELRAMELRIKQFEAETARMKAMADTAAKADAQEVDEYEAETGRIKVTGGDGSAPPGWPQQNPEPNPPNGGFFVGQ